MSMFDLTGKVALFTGASKGMGFEMAKGLAEHGATVVISSRTQDDLDAAAGEINALGNGPRRAAATSYMRISCKRLWTRPMRSLALSTSWSAMRA